MAQDVLSMIPVVTFPEDEGQPPLSFGMDGILFDGKEFPFATVGHWRIEIGQDEVTTLHVGIAVKLGGIPR